MLIFPQQKSVRFSVFALYTNDFLFEACRGFLTTCTQITLISVVLLCFLAFTGKTLETIVSMLLSAQDY